MRRTCFKDEILQRTGNDEDRNINKYKIDPPKKSTSAANDTLKVDNAGNSEQKTIDTPTSNSLGNGSNTKEENDTTADKAANNQSVAAASVSAPIVDVNTDSVDNVNNNIDEKRDKPCSTAYSDPISIKDVKCDINPIETMTEALPSTDVMNSSKVEISGNVENNSETDENEISISNSDKRIISTLYCSKLPHLSSNNGTQNSSAKTSPPSKQIESVILIENDHSFQANDNVLIDNKNKVISNHGDGGINTESAQDSAALSSKESSKTDVTDVEVSEAQDGRGCENMSSTENKVNITKPSSAEKNGESMLIEGECVSDKKDGSTRDEIAVCDEGSMYSKTRSGSVTESEKLLEQSSLHLMVASELEADKSVNPCDAGPPDLVSDEITNPSHKGLPELAAYKSPLLQSPKSSNSVELEEGELQETTDEEIEPKLQELKSSDSVVTVNPKQISANDKIIVASPSHCKPETDVVRRSTRNMARNISNSDINKPVNFKPKSRFRERRSKEVPSPRRLEGRRYGRNSDKYSRHGSFHPSPQKIYRGRISPDKFHQENRRSPRKHVSSNRAFDDAHFNKSRERRNQPSKNIHKTPEKRANFNVSPKANKNVNMKTPTKAGLNYSNIHNTHSTNSFIDFSAISMNPTTNSEFENMTFGEESNNTMFGEQYRRVARRQHHVLDVLDSIKDKYGTKPPTSFAHIANEVPHNKPAPMLGTNSSTTSAKTHEWKLIKITFETKTNKTALCLSNSPRIVILTTKSISGLIHVWLRK